MKNQTDPSLFEPQGKTVSGTSSERNASVTEVHEINLDPFLIARVTKYIHSFTGTASKKIAGRKLISIIMKSAGL
ncbi:MAG: hypothetical protein MUD12_01305 [Spirochaetes bacterium]|nr:hypothetical protein [Spirochaetota bacterium]